MNDIILTKTRLIEGVWEGIISGISMDAKPAISVNHLGKAIEGVEVLANDKNWGIRVPIPSALISDGVQTFVVLNHETEEKLGSFALLAGDALADDIRAEVDLLRAELDMLKSAFRRHCSETN